MGGGREEERQRERESERESDRACERASECARAVEVTVSLFRNEELTFK